MTPDLNPADDFKPDAETLADADSLDYKHCPVTDPSHQLQKKAGGVVGLVGGTFIGSVVAGPVGALIGAAIGGTVGTLAGKIGGELVDPSAEPEYWMKHHGDQAFVKPGSSYMDYEPAYRAGYNNYTPGESFQQAEPDLILYYDNHGGLAHLPWEEARPAAKAAWDRLTYIFPLEKMNHF